VALKADLDQRFAALSERHRKWIEQAKAYNERFAGREIEGDSQDYKDALAQETLLNQELREYETAIEGFRADIDEFYSRSLSNGK
jgi:hypothetical protein